MEAVEMRTGSRTTQGRSARHGHEGIRSQRARHEGADGMRNKDGGFNVSR